VWLFAAMQTFCNDVAFAYKRLFRHCVAYNHSTIDPLDLIEWSRVRLLMTWNFYLFFIYRYPISILKPF
jgi:hypothetical protein